MASKSCKLLLVSVLFAVLVYLGAHLLIYLDHTSKILLTHSKVDLCQPCRQPEKSPTVDNLDGQNQNLNHKQVSESAGKRLIPGKQNSTIGGYLVGKRLVYSPITGCKQPQLLEGYSGNPCWKHGDSKQPTRLVCAPKVVILGAHKCGTTDMRESINSHEQAMAVAFEAYSSHSMSEPSCCPTDFYSSDPNWTYREWYVNEASKGHTTAISSAGCYKLFDIVKETPDHFLVRSCVQMFTFYQSDETRYMYIFTLRNPTKRMFSFYFHLQQVGRYGNITQLAKKKTPESIGYDVLHQFVERSLKEIEDCLRIYGVTKCIILPSTYAFQKAEIIIIDMIVSGCYSIFLEKVYKYIPKERLYINMLEEYSVDESKAMVKISEFIGLSSSKYSSGNDKESQVVRNQGANQKPVHKKTVELLDKFYQPFNQRLAVMLGDDNSGCILDNQFTVNFQPKIVETQRLI